MRDISQNLFDKKSQFERHKDVTSRLIIGEEVNRSPLISIVIPTYKRAELLHKAIESALNQSEFDNYEIVVVDNNPARGCPTETLIHEIWNKKIRYYKNDKNIGMTGNWNRCYELSRGIWVAMLHDDDLLLSNYLKDIQKFLNKNFQVINVSYHKMNERKYKEIANLTSIKRQTYIYKYSKFDFLFGFRIGAPLGMIVNKDFFLTIGGFDELYYPSIDYAFIVKASNFGSVIKIHGNIMGIYRIFENESLNPEVLNKFLYKNKEIKRSILRNLDYRILKSTFEKSFENYQKRYIKNHYLHFGTSENIINDNSYNEALNPISYNLLQKGYFLIYLFRKVYFSLKYFTLINLKS